MKIQVSKEHLLSFSPRSPPIEFRQPQPGQPYLPPLRVTRLVPPEPRVAVDSNQFFKGSTIAPPLSTLQPRTEEKYSGSFPKDLPAPPATSSKIVIDHQQAFRSGNPSQNAQSANPNGPVGQSGPEKSSKEFENLINVFKYPETQATFKELPPINVQEQLEIPRIPLATGVQDLQEYPSLPLDPAMIELNKARLNALKPVGQITSMEDLARSGDPNPAYLLPPVTTRSSYHLESSTLLCDSEKMIESRFILKAASLFLLILAAIFGLSFLPQFRPVVTDRLSEYWWTFFFCLGACLLVYVLLFAIPTLKTFKWVVWILYFVFLLGAAATSLYPFCLTDDPTNIQIIYGFLLVVGILHVLIFATKRGLVSFYSTLVGVIFLILGTVGFLLIYLPDNYLAIIGASIGVGGFGVVLSFDYAQTERCSRNFYYHDEYVLAAILLPIGLIMILYFWAKSVADTIGNADSRTFQNLRASLRQSFLVSYRHVSRRSINGLP